MKRQVLVWFRDPDFRLSHLLRVDFSPHNASIDERRMIHLHASHLVKCLNRSARI